MTSLAEAVLAVVMTSWPHLKVISSITAAESDLGKYISDRFSRPLMGNVGLEIDT